MDIKHSAKPYESKRKANIYTYWYYTTLLPHFYPVFGEDSGICTQITCPFICVFLNNNLIGIKQIIAYILLEKVKIMQVRYNLL